MNKEVANGPLSKHLIVFTRLNAFCVLQIAIGDTLTTQTQTSMLHSKETTDQLQFSSRHEHIYISM